MLIWMILILLGIAHDDKETCEPFPMMERKATLGKLTPEIEACLKRDFDNPLFISSKVGQKATQSMSASQRRYTAYVRVRTRDKFGCTGGGSEVNDQTGCLLLGRAMFTGQHGGERCRDVHR